jgi:hypothetical protein
MVFAILIAAGIVSRSLPIAANSAVGSSAVPELPKDQPPNVKKAADIEILRPPYEFVFITLPPPVITDGQESVASPDAVATISLPETNQDLQIPPEPQRSPPRGMYGTSLQFAANSFDAMKQAAQQSKLVFLLHVSGDFENPGLT